MWVKTSSTGFQLQPDFMFTNFRERFSWTMRQYESSALKFDCVDYNIAGSNRIQTFASADHNTRFTSTRLQYVNAFNNYKQRFSRCSFICKWILVKKNQKIYQNCNLLFFFFNVFPKTWCPNYCLSFWTYCNFEFPWLRSSRYIYAETVCSFESFTRHFMYRYSCLCFVLCGCSFQWNIM